MGKQLSKEEILGLPFYPHDCGGMIECVTKQDALKSMDIYAKQTSIAFTEWVEEKKYIKHHSKYYWSNREPEAGVQTFFTTEQLYELFLQSLNQQ